MKTKELFSLVSGLSGVTRFSMLKMCHRETVLEHTGMIAVFAYVLGTRLNQFAGKGIMVHMGVLLSKAIVHDWDETITGDVARPTKYYSDTLRNELHRLETDGVQDIADLLEISNAAHHHADAKEGVEGYIVSLCDIACAIHRCWEEVLVYNNMHFVLPSQRLRMVLHKTHSRFAYEDFAKNQRDIIDSFVLDLNNILNKILQKGNGELREMAHAN